MLGGSSSPVLDDKKSRQSRLDLTSPDPPMSSPSPGSNAADNILRRCAPLETRDSGPSLPSLHKSRNDAMPPLPLRGFAFQNDDDGPLLHGGGGHRGRWRGRKRSNNSPSRKSRQREIASNRRRFAEAKPQPKTRRSISPLTAGCRRNR